MRCAGVAEDDKWNQRRRVNDLPDVMQITVGMKVMITSNIETDLNMMNGVQGKIVNIILHPDKPPLGDKLIVTLQHLPSYILVKLKRTHAERLEDLDESEIPIELSTHSFQINGKYIYYKKYLPPTVSNDSHIRVHRFSLTRPNSSMCDHRHCITNRWS
jgi:hypothetical protein